MRPPLPDLNALTSEQRAIYEDILAGPRGRLDPPLAVWLNSPGLARTAQELGGFCRYGTSLPPRLSELAILITGSWWRASFEWAVHAPIAIAAGLDEAVVEQIRKGIRPDFSAQDELCVYDFASELLNERRISDHIYAAAEAALGTTGLVDLVGILGYYGLISMTLNAFQIPAPGNAKPF
ncbi:4-carboxymuconolactone decarboxylase [Sphingobium sp. SA916]|nr:4-carboxymuconolactone decarboxylase [Sphingobium sp. SA916]